MSQGKKRSSNSMTRGKNLEPIPTDLIIEILLRLPAKSIARFYCVSKLWTSILHRPYFTELFLTRSSARPRILFAVEGQGEWSLYSSAWPYAKSSSLIEDVDFQMKFPRVENMWISRSGGFPYGYASGLIYFPDMWILKERVKKRVIFNPSTGQYTILPKLIMRCRNPSSFLGFDPIDKQFKVLLLGYNDYDHKVLTLGTGELRWRKIQCPLIHKPLSGGICINGVLYYLAEEIDDISDDETPCVIVCFEVRSEKFKFIEADSFCRHSPNLINYKGKLAGIRSKHANVDGFDELSMWVLEDVDKQEWSKHVYTLPKNNIVEVVSVVGITARGEFVLAKEFTFEQFYVCYFNPERNTLQTVNIQGFRTNVEASGFSRVNVFVDHIEDLNFNDAKQLKSSISTPSVKNNRSLDIITKGQNHSIRKKAKEEEEEEEEAAKRREIERGV